MDAGIYSRQLFCITSQNCSGFASWLYGWRMKKHTLESSCALPPYEDGLLSDTDDPGAHVCMLRNGNIITLRTDPLGNCMLWLYRKSSFWAVSNSYHLLARSLREDYGQQLHINDGWAAQLLLCYASPFIFGESLCSEIQMLPADALLKIDLEKRALQITYPSIPVNRVSLLSEEGVAIVDKWINIWTGFIKAYLAAGIPMATDISGGYDSRIGLGLLLAANADMDSCGLQCNDSGGDLEIALELSRKMNFKLNRSARRYFRINPEQSYNRYLFSRRGLDTGNIKGDVALPELNIRLTGFSGELHRASWYETPGDISLIYTDKFGGKLHQQALQAFWRNWKKLTSNPLRNFGKALSEKELMVHFYELSKRRLHFGSGAMECLLGNMIILQPLSHPLLYRIHQHDCPGRDTLFAFIMTRIGGMANSVPYENNKTFSTACWNTARDLDKKYPFHPQHIVPEQPAAIRGKPIKFDEYDGTEGLQDFLRAEIYDNIDIFASSYPEIITNYVLQTNNFTHGNVPHVAAIIDIIGKYGKYNNADIKL